MVQFHSLPLCVCVCDVTSLAVPLLPFVQDGVVQVVVDHVHVRFG